MRLDKLLSHATGLSRKQVKIALKAGRVEVDGQTCKDAATDVRQHDVLLDGQPISEPQPRYLMLHKPAGYVCSQEDDGHPSVFRLLGEMPRRDQLHVAGRLDADTTGLLLITDDGHWSHRITSPRRHCGKRYRVLCVHPHDQEQRQRLADGVRLNDDPEPTLPAEVESIDSQTLLLTLHEGRYHQVKRMLAAVGNRVDALHREAVGTLTLGTLQEGDYRPLTPEEIAELGH